VILEVLEPGPDLREHRIGVAMGRVLHGLSLGRRRRKAGRHDRSKHPGVAHRASK
jgi:hypothetical protein